MIDRDQALSGRVRRIVAVTIAAVMVSAAQVAPRAQTSSQLDTLRQELEAAREEIERVQSQADDVDDQISSLDRQLLAVQRAVDASTALVERTQAEIGLLQREVATTTRRYRTARSRAEDVAVVMYKAGPTAAVDTMLGAEDLGELMSYVEYSSAVSDDQNAIAVAAARLGEELAAQKAELEAKLAEAQELRAEQLAQRQHLAELRAAEELKLARLRERIASEREEAEAIADRSAEIQAQLASLAAEAPPAPSVGAPSAVSVGASGSSGFAWPIRGAITSGYGPRWGRMHEGIDIDCVTGNPIGASRAGRVVTAAYDGSGYGYHVIIDHGGGFASLYAHMSELYVGAGDSLAQGETVGACGSTGASTGDHVHFEIRVNGAPQDPLRYLP